MKTLNWLPVVLWLACGMAPAQVAVEKSVPAPPRGEVCIENAFGSVKIVGWDREEVALKGRVAAGAEGIEIDHDEDRVYIEVEVPESWYYGEGENGGDSESYLEISVPRASSLSIETLNASVTIREHEGIVEIESVNGGVTVSGSPSIVNIETITGAVEVTAEAAEMAVESVAGSVTLRGVAKAVEVATVSGSITIEGSDLKEIDLSTTSGNVEFSGNLAPRASVQVEAFSGNVRLAFPANVKTRFDLATFSGQIDSDVGPEPSREDKFSPYKRLRFSTDLEDSEVSVETFSGNIAVRTRK